MSSHKDKAARQRYQREYYLAHKEQMIAYGKAYRETHKIFRVAIGVHARDLLKKLAEEDGIPVAEELRRLIYREHAIRTLARGNHAQAMD